MLPGFPQHPALPRGTSLKAGRYRIEREVNRGGTAVVYCALDTETRTYVALKVMRPEQVPLHVVNREITFSRNVSHDNIVRLLDAFEEGQQLVIVWELISGPDLLDLLNECRGRMPEDMAAFYFTQALRGLIFMHATGFCHRDIKPDNCMVQRANHQLKLIDFGLSKHLASAKTIGVGTPDYMSPEMLRDEPPQYDQHGVQIPPYDARRVDAWAMGVLMYLLVSGQYPFQDSARPDSLSATVHNILDGRRRPLPPDISPGCAELISGLLEYRPERRTTLLDLVNNRWLSLAAAQYARRVASSQGQPGPEHQWIDLREYRYLAAMDGRSRRHQGPQQQHQTQQQQGYAPRVSGNGSANPAASPTAAPGRSPFAAVAGRSPFSTTAAAPAGPSAMLLPGAPSPPRPQNSGLSDGSAGGGGGHHGGAAGFFARLLPAGSNAGSEELAAVAGAMQSVAGVRPIAASGAKGGSSPRHPQPPQPQFSMSSASSQAHSSQSLSPQQSAQLQKQQQLQPEAPPSPTKQGMLARLATLLRRR